MDSNKDVLAKAVEYSTNNVDLYDLVRIDPSTTEEKEIRRAWRKESIKYHPDKLQDKFDPEKWELFENALEILLDAAARAAYDNARKAALMRKAERARVHGVQRRFIDELEAAEEEARQKRVADEERAREVEREKARQRDEGLRRMAEEDERFRKENLERMQKERERREMEREPDDDDRKLEELQRRRDELKRQKDEKRAKKKMARAMGREDEIAEDAAGGVAGSAPPKKSRSPLHWGNLRERMQAAQRLKDVKMEQAQTMAGMA